MFVCLTKDYYRPTFYEMKMHDLLQLQFRASCTLQHKTTLLSKFHGGCGPGCGANHTTLYVSRQMNVHDCVRAFVIENVQ